MERDDRRLDEEAGEQEGERAHEQPVRAAAAKRLADLREVERAGAAIEQPDGEQHEDRPGRVRHREAQGPLQRRALVDLVADQDVRGDAEELEEDEQVKEVAGQAEPRHAGEEHEHERVELVPAVGHDSGGDDERQGREGGRERRHRRAGVVDRQRDPDRRAATRLPAPDPQHHRPRVHAPEQDRGEHGDRSGGGEREQRRRAPGQDRPGAHERRRRKERHEQAQRRGRHPRSAPSRSGSTVPKRLATWTVSASSTAATVASTTTSVSVSAWTTGSTTGVRAPMPA